MEKKEIIEEIAKKHHIILDETDPIFAVVTANELILNEFSSKLDKLATKHKSDLESFKITILRELREYSKDNQEALKSLMRNEAALSAPVVTKKDDGVPKKEFKKYLLWGIFFQVVFLLVGVIIGTLI